MRTRRRRRPRARSGVPGKSVRSRSDADGPYHRCVPAATTTDRRARVAAATVLVMVVGAAVAAALVLAAPIAVAGAATGTATVPVPPSTGPTAGGAVGLPTPPIPVGDCPWLARAMAAGDTPSALAALTEQRMTLDEKLGELVLTTSGDYENVERRVGRLCIPSLTLSDGPWGLAFGDTGVTQLPVPLAVGATFDPAAALEYGAAHRRRGGRTGHRRQPGPEPQHRPGPDERAGRRVLRRGPAAHHGVGMADIEGIQARGVMAQAKHLVVYSQETNRGALDDEVPPGRSRRSTCRRSRPR